MINKNYIKHGHKAVRTLLTAREYGRTFDNIDHGMCHGLAYTWINAFLLGETLRFDNRIRFITSMTESELVTKIETAKKSQTDLIKRLKSEVPKEDFRKELDKLTDPAVLDLLEIDAFLEHTVMCHRGVRYSFFSGTDEGQSAQNGFKSLKFFNHIKLKNNKDLHLHSSFCGVYNSREFNSYLKALRESITASTTTFVVELTNCKHTIALSFDIKTNSWVYFDSNYMPTQYFQNDAQLAAFIFKSLKSKDWIVISSKVITKGSPPNALDEFNDWQKKISDLHEVNRLRANIVDVHGNSWLYMHADAEHINKTIISKLVELQVDHTTVTMTNRLHAAVDCSKDNFLKIVLKSNSVNPNTLLYESTLIQRATFLNCRKTLRRVLAHPKADPNMQSFNSKPALHLAAEYNRVRATKLLLEHPLTDPNLKSACGKTPLYIAAEVGNIGVLKVLLSDKRVDTKLLSNGLTNLHIAKQNHHDKVIEALESLSVQQENVSKRSHQITR